MVILIVKMVMFLLFLNDFPIKKKKLKKKYFSYIVPILWKNGDVHFKTVFFHKKQCFFQRLRCNFHRPQFGKATLRAHARPATPGAPRGCTWARPRNRTRPGKQKKAETVDVGTDVVHLISVFFPRLGKSFSDVEIVVFHSIRSWNWSLRLPFWLRQMLNSTSWSNFWNWLEHFSANFEPCESFEEIADTETSTNHDLSNMSFSENMPVISWKNMKTWCCPASTLWSLFLVLKMGLKIEKSPYNPSLEHLIQDIGNGPCHAIEDQLQQRDQRNLFFVTRLHCWLRNGGR